MKKIIYIVSIIILLAGYTYFHQVNNNQSADAITIGMIAGVSGPFASTGESVVKGAQLAVEEWNANPKNTHVTLVLEDDAFDPKKGLSAYQKLISIDGIDGLFNMTSPTMNALYPTVISNNTITMQFGEQDINPEVDSVFNIGSSIPVQTEAGRYLKKTRPDDSVLVVMNNDSTLSRFVEGIEAGYGSEIKKIKTTYTETDYKTVAAQIIAENPDTLIIALIPDNGVALINALSVYESRPHVLFSFFSLDDYTKLGSNLSYINGAEIISFKDATTADFKERFEKRFGHAPGLYADYAYDGMWALISGHDADTEEWKENILDLDYQGVSGAVEFDATGTRLTELQMQKLVGKEVVDIF